MTKGERAKNIRGMLTFCGLKEDENINRIARRGKEMGRERGERGREIINHVRDYERLGKG